MKLRRYIYQIESGPDHDRLLGQLMDRAERLGLHCDRAVIGGDLASGSALLFLGVIPEQGEAFSPGINLSNWRLHYLRESLDPMSIQFKP